MEALLVMEDPAEMKRRHAPETFPPLSAEDLARHAPDAHWLVPRGKQDTAARCSLWWRSVPRLSGHRLGIIGHYAAIDDDAGRRLLLQSCAALRTHGCTLAIGPMDGSTWRRYRFVTDRGTAPAFFLEPDNPCEWPSHFSDVGFTPIAHYFSALNQDLNRSDPRLPEVAARLARQNIALRCLDPRRLDDELGRIYSISVKSFSKNFLYSPMDETEFRAQYRSMRSLIKPELVLIAEQNESPVGFLFAVPDILQAQHRKEIDTVVIKTVAVLADRAHAGLGSLLVARAQEHAQQLGFKGAIHALMHESNESRNISRRYAQPIRGYTLFARELV